MIHGFEKFKENLILESLNESILYFSPKMIDHLKDCNDKISNELLKINRSDTGIDMTFVDVDDINPGFVTFFKMDKAKKLAGKQYPPEYLDNPNNPLSDYDSDLIFQQTIAGQEGKSSIRLGRFINKVTKEKFKSVEIESFVNKFKSKVNSNKEEFILVSGPEIEKWYRKEMVSDTGRLGSIHGSCMTGMKNVFGIYTDNPESCQLLVLTYRGKALGRALVWKVHKSTTPMEYFMDRVYFTHEYQVQSFNLYAKKRGWGIRSNYMEDELTIGDQGYFFSEIGLEVKVKPRIYKKYPYLDTIPVYDPNKGILYPSKHDPNGKLVLRRTNGDCTDYRSKRKKIIDRFRNFFTS